MILKLKFKSYTIKVIISVAFFIVCLSLLGCKTAKLNPSADYQIKFLDEYILDDFSFFKNKEIGGLSGVDYNGEHFILISDKSKSPDIFQVDIQIEHFEIKTIKFKQHLNLSCAKVNIFDTESIRFLPGHSGYLVSTEGHINSNENAQILEVNHHGKCTKTYDLPRYFNINYSNKPRHNGVFEGLSLDYKHEGFWVVNELPLKEDGHRPKLYNTYAPVRITHYNFEEFKPDIQFSYDLERLVKVPLLPFGLNGVTEILQIDKTHMLVVERSFSAGHGSKGNRVKLFLIDLSLGKNTIDLRYLMKNNSNSIPKILIFDSKHIKNKLKYNFIDNIEGITFGPDLPNGNKSLILVSDNNFNALGKQLNQFILLELLRTN